MMQLVFTRIRYDFKQTPVISSDVVTEYDLTQVLYMHCFNLEDDSTRVLLMQCGAITIHQPVRTGLMEILMMTPEGKKPYSQTDLLVREPQTFSLISQTQMKAVYFFLRVYIVIL